jgi:hypothetical protein
MANMGNNMKDQGNKLRCEKCNQSFDSQQRLDDHNREMHNR